MALGSPETDDWKGKQITMYNDRTVSFAGKLTGGIRIRPNAPDQAQTGGAAPTQPVDEMDDSIQF